MNGVDVFAVSVIVWSFSVAIGYAIGSVCRKRKETTLSDKLSEWVPNDSKEEK